MDSQILGLRVASIIFGLMSLAQLLRLVIQPEVLVAGHQMPLWPSVLALVILDERVQTYAGGLHRGAQSRANFWSFPVSELTRPRL
jgi:hypothetical protein